jgi:hypothetical protein
VLELELLELDDKLLLLLRYAEIALRIVLWLKQSIIGHQRHNRNWNSYIKTKKLLKGLFQFGLY